MNKYRVPIRVSGGGWTRVEFRANSPFDANDPARTAHGDKVMGSAEPC